MSPQMAEQRGNPAELTREIITRLSALARLHLEQLRAEVANRISLIVVAAVLGVAAIFFLSVGVIFALASATAGIATVYSVWLSFLIMFGAIIAIGLAFAVGTILVLRRIRGMTATGALAEMERTVASVTGQPGAAQIDNHERP